MAVSVHTGLVAVSVFFLRVLGPLLYILSTLTISPFLLSSLFLFSLFSFPLSLPFFSVVSLPLPLSLSSFPSPPLSSLPLSHQLRREKVQLEQTLEQEQEQQISKLTKKISRLEKDVLAKQTTLEKVSE